MPQVLTAITASLLGASLARRFSTKRVYLTGLVAGLLATILLFVSQFFESDTSVAFPMLLVATAFLGVGFGLTVPALNTLTAAFHPQAVRVFGARAQRAPRTRHDARARLRRDLRRPRLLVGLPLTSAILLTGLILLSLGLPLQTGAPEAAAGATRGIPSRFWVFAGFAVLYGLCETVNANWSQLDMTSELGASTTEAAVALTAFWAMVTADRVLFAAVERWVPPRVTYHVLPFLLGGTFVPIGFLPHGGIGLAIFAFALAGLGCSALLPLTIGFGQEELVSMSAAAAGEVIAFYQVGYASRPSESVR